MMKRLIVACMGLFAAVASANTLDIPAGVPAIIVKTASISVSGKAQMDLRPTDFPFNPKYWETYTPCGVTVSWPDGFVADATQQVECYNICEYFGGACFNNSACLNFKQCRMLKYAQMWSDYQGLKEAIEACCTQYMPDTPDMQDCISAAFASWAPLVMNDLLDVHACCPGCP